MAIERFNLRETPVITAELLTNDTVSVTIYDKDGNIVALDSNTATENVAGSGKYDYELDFTTKPTSGKNYYDAKFTGTLQTVWKTFSWDEIVSEFGGKVCIDVVNGSAGQGFPIGTDDTPSNNLADAKAIADRNSFSLFCLSGPLTLDRALSGYQIDGKTQVGLDIVNLNNQNVDSSSFQSVTLTGQCNGSIFCTRCFLYLITDFNGIAQESAINDGITVKVGGSFQGSIVYGNSTTGAAPYLDFQNNPASIAGIADFQGLLEVKNFIGGLLLLGGNGIYTFDSTCTGGIILISGDHGSVTDNSGAGCVILDYRNSNVDDIWDEARSGHTTTGSMGEVMKFVMAHVGGRLKLNATTNQAELYDTDNTTLVASFDLKDFADNAAVRNIADRLRV